MINSDILILFSQAGIMKIPLLLCSVWGLYLVIHGLLFLFFNRIKFDMVDQLKARYLSSGKQSALHELRHEKGFPSQVMAHALTITHLEKSDINADLEHFLHKEISGVDRTIAFLSAIITAAPMLGLLGTVLGIIKIFDVVSGTAIGGDITKLSAGVAESLLTTAAGLFIAIPLIFFHQYLSNKVDAYLVELEQVGHDVVLFCQTNEPGGGQG